MILLRGKKTYIYTSGDRRWRRGRLGRGGGDGGSVDGQRQQSTLKFAKGRVPLIFEGEFSGVQGQHGGHENKFQASALEDANAVIIVTVTMNAATEEEEDAMASIDLESWTEREEDGWREGQCRRVVYIGKAGIKPEQE